MQDKERAALKLCSRAAFCNDTFGQKIPLLYFIIALKLITKPTMIPAIRIPVPINVNTSLSV